MKSILILLMAFLFVGCANKKCHEMRDEAKAATPGVPSGAAAPASVDKEKDPMSKTALADRVKVHKPDGSQQCGMGKALSISEMQKQLGALKVHRSYNKNDGMMRIQMCGAPTGNSNVYEIDRKDLSEAIKAGFKEWTVE